MDEGQLRYVLTLAPENHEEMVRQIVDFHLTTRQVKDLCEHGNDPEPPSEPPSHAARLAKFMQSSGKVSVGDLVQVLLQQEGDIHLVRARIQGLRTLLDEAERTLAEE